MNLKKAISKLSFYYFNIPNDNSKHRNHIIREFYANEYIQGSLMLEKKINKVFS